MISDRVRVARRDATLYLLGVTQFTVPDSSLKCLSLDHLCPRGGGRLAGDEVVFGT